MRNLRFIAHFGEVLATNCYYRKDGEKHIKIGSNKCLICEHNKGYYSRPGENYMRCNADETLDEIVFTDVRGF